MMASVNISVKAPNQKVGDQEYTFSLGCSVKELKDHIKQHYPGNPEPAEQKLIYMGKLLDGSSLLQDVLKPDMHNKEGCHTVHLVCSSADKAAEVNRNDSSNADVSHLEHVPAAESSDDTSEILPCVLTPTIEQSQSLDMSWSLTTSSVPTMMPGMPYTPEQMIWLQQIYAQQMATYMHLLQHGYHYEELENTEGSNPPDNDNGELPMRGPARPQQNNQQMVMNAAGGQAMFEDEDEDVNRDWLDWSYVMCRFAVLLAIVYFYSTLGRFFMVFGFFFMIYLYQNGWFRLNRRVARPHRQEDILPENERTQAAEEANVQPEPERPGLMRIILSFFVTFFTSLIPQQPGPVNAN